MSEINIHVMEMRFPPNPKILDDRGKWTESISEALSLSQWRIDQNRIDVFDEDDMHHGFVSFTNAGYYARDNQTKNYFPDNAAKFLKALFQLNNFGKTQLIERLGVRSKFCKPYKGEFNTLVKKYGGCMASINDRALKILDAKIIDIGSPLTLQDDIATINFMGGPMNSKQLSEVFKKEEDLPEVALFFDIDRWIRPGKELDLEAISNNIRAFSSFSWEKMEQLTEHIFS